MELQTEPDTYTPSVNNLGQYVDVVPSFNNIRNGMRCPCASRKGKTYITNTLFSSHTKTKIHQTWLLNLNLNKANYFIESENLKSIVKDQRIVIAQMDKDLQSKNLTIDYLTQQLMAKNCVDNTVDNLLLFD
jgi:hypothetical protein